MTPKINSLAESLAIEIVELCRDFGTPLHVGDITFSVYGYDDGSKKLHVNNGNMNLQAKPVDCLSVISSFYSTAINF